MRSFGPAHLSGYQTYSTGLALSALSSSATVPGMADQVAASIALGRTFLEDSIQTQGSSPSSACSTTYASSGDTSYYCGGWNFSPAPAQRSDESDTWFALMGLQSTGGVSPSVQQFNLGWQSNIQADSAMNPHWSSGSNDGGGGWQPAYVGDGTGFASNANDTGSMLFGFAADGLTISDSRVDSGLQFATDVLDTYEKTANDDSGGTGYETGPHTMVYHDGAQEDGPCIAGSNGCDWDTDAGEGGFHYSMYSMAQGIGAFIAPDLSDGSNWYATITDLLVAEQDTTTVCTPNAGTCSFGSWPSDGRDDFDTLFSTAMSISALGVGDTSATVTTLSPVSTATTLSSVQNPSTVGQQVTFTATVSPTPDGGTVAFADNETTIPGCGAVSVDTSTGAAVCQSSFGAVGSYSIVATYSGDTDFLESASSMLTQNVNPTPTPTPSLVATSTSVSCRPSTVGLGRATRCVATVTDASPDAGKAPTGTVSFRSTSEGKFSSPGGTCTLSSGATSAFCTVTYTPRSRGSGIDMLTVLYRGDGTHGSSSDSTRISIAGRPSAKITSPDGGHTYEIGQLVHTRFSCCEGPRGPGIASCKDSNGASSPHGRLNTRRTGRHTYTVTATSRDGLTRRVSIRYTVVASG
jgi:hypothetical protein